MVNGQQKKFVIEHLNACGFISRNTCLKNYISRLGAIIHRLKKEGWSFVTEWRETEYSKDFIYRVKDNPNSHKDEDY